MSVRTFDIDQAIQDIAKILPSQGPLKEFVAQNPLRGFLDCEFHDALRKSAATFGAWSYLPLGFYRKAWTDGLISNSALQRSLDWNIDDLAARERTRADLFEYPEGSSTRPSSFVQKGVRAQWAHFTGCSIIDKSLPVIFRLLAAYLDQGISVWRMPTGTEGFLSSIKQLVTGSWIPYNPLDQSIVKQLLHFDIDDLILRALERLVGDPKLYERYIQDMIMSHPGWSSTINFLETNPNGLVLKKKITLKEMIAVELLIDAGFLQEQFGVGFSSLAHYGPTLNVNPVESSPPVTRLEFIKCVWHEAWEWSFYEQSLSLVTSLRKMVRPKAKATVQALFCIDDRECSIRRYLENQDSTIKTFGLPGFFGVDFMYQCADDSYPTRHAPIVLSPKHLITSRYENENHRKNRTLTGRFLAMDHASHTMFRGWIITQLLGISAAIRMALAVFKPTMAQTTASSLTRANEFVKLELERPIGDVVFPDGYIHGFSIEEMADKVMSQLQAIGLTEEFAPIIVLFAHGSSSTNNTHFSAYDCGACSGKPGTPNSRVFAQMANHPEVRKVMAFRGLVIPSEVKFVAALHDTTRDEVKYFDLRLQSETTRRLIKDFSRKMSAALELNAKERCRRFELVSETITPKDALIEVKRRSVAIFEPRPELTHTGNAMAIIGRRHLTEGGFFDRRAFLHSYDPSIDSNGDILRRILGAVVPVCGGINLCYYFSKLDSDVYGAGTKLPHNIIGLIGVANGVEGDIQTGLPRQMVEFHDPIRLQLLIEQKPDIVEQTFAKEPNLQKWIKNNWMRLVCIDPDTADLWVWKKNQFISLPQSELTQAQVKNTVQNCFEGHSENCPLTVISSGHSVEVRHGA